MSALPGTIRVLCTLLCLAGFATSHAQDAPELNIIMKVSGGRAGPGDWLVNVTATNPSKTGFPGSESDMVTIDPGTYSVDVSGGPEGYTKRLSGCSDDKPLEANDFTYCTIILKASVPQSVVDADGTGAGTTETATPVLHERVGEVYDESPRRSNSIEREPVPLTPLNIQRNGAAAVRINDILKAGENSWLKFTFKEAEDGNIRLESDGDNRGELKLAGSDEDPTCELKSGNAYFQGKNIKDFLDPGSQKCKVENQSKDIEDVNTEFLIHAGSVESSLFVIEGEVVVTSTEPELENDQPVTVFAGEWLRFRKGESLGQPLRFRRSDARSGSLQCIRSNCGFIDEVPPNLPPRPPLSPPPPNPPGRR